MYVAQEHHSNTVIRFLDVKAWKLIIVLQFFMTLPLFPNFP